MHGISRVPGHQGLQEQHEGGGLSPQCSNIFKGVKTCFTNMILCDMPIFRTNEAGGILEAGD